MKKPDFMPFIVEGGNEFIEQCSSAVSRIDVDSPMDLYIDTLYDKLSKMNPLLLSEMIANYYTDGQLNQDQSDNILMITSLLSAADQQLDEALHQISSSMLCSPDFFDEWIEQKSSELFMFTEEKPSSKTEDPQEELNLIRETEQITESARQQILQELLEEGISMEDPDIGQVLVEKTIESLSAVKAMMHIRSALYMMRDESDHTEPVCLSLLLSSAGIQAETVLKTIAQKAGIDYEKLEEVMDEEWDASETADRLNEAFQFLQSQLTDSQMRS